MAMTQAGFWQFQADDAEPPQGTHRAVFFLTGQVPGNRPLPQVGEDGQGIGWMRGWRAN